MPREGEQWPVYITDSLPGHGIAKEISMSKAKVPLLCDPLAKHKTKPGLRFPFLRAQPDFLLTSLFLAYQALLSPEAPADTGFQFPCCLWEVSLEKNLQDPVVQILKMAEVEEKPYFLLVPASWEATPWWSFQSQALGGPFPSSFPRCQILACSQDGVTVWRAHMLCTVLPKSSESNNSLWWGEHG